jgi:hypothetical protein
VIEAAITDLRELTKKSLSTPDRWRSRFHTAAAIDQTKR